MSPTACPGTADTLVAACRIAVGAAETGLVHDIRRAVFVTEQGLFDGSDLDEHDADPATIDVLGTVGGAPAGTVRLFPLDPADPTGDWKGDRLAVLPEFRASGLGGPLVRFAVATAGARGGRRMQAMVQLANEAFFLRLGWRRLGAPELYVGRPHLRMDIDLQAARAAC
ncbi:MSMEG_0567/Sll0786 family nitrogen starvation N-acetyltransferase [Pseudonocardia benzenivorans]|uniref:MSMEG_0567/Sll0786 family nitrogen starvation N-acetyltransferase n=1 Tax=Pseudonocardia benzenivorans TaxID=228005 RepID=A0ABW3VKZ3_9PSEU|nr:MSMEG_0567/Sll0786 family nitrogen starvation N-acetyltransferase [Pseudonocardia dioxanivorans]GJF05582.1 hypothetical protein PSD17_45330 [Pseudonocardia sp. D17]